MCVILQTAPRLCITVGLSMRGNKFTKDSSVIEVLLQLLSDIVSIWVFFYCNVIVTVCYQVQCAVEHSQRHKNCPSTKTLLMEKLEPGKKSELQVSRPCKPMQLVCNTTPSVVTEATNQTTLTATSAFPSRLSQTMQLGEKWRPWQPSVPMRDARGWEQSKNLRCSLMHLLPVYCPLNCEWHTHHLVDIKQQL